MTTLYLVSCVSKKRLLECVGADPLQYPAADLYLSDWFKKAKAYVTQPGRLPFDSGQRLWGILSAKHGFLTPNTFVTPYDQTLKAMTKEERSTWSKMTFTQLLNYIATNKVDRVVFFAGELYRAELVELFEKVLRWVTFNEVFIPLKHKGIGEQKSYFKKNTPNV